jgi:hypothetical protein
MTHPDDSHHQVIGRCEQVMVHGYPLRQVLGADQLAPGTFFADVTHQTLWVWDMANRDLNQAHTEASVREEVFRVEGDHVQVAGIRFRYAANRAQRGAVVLAGNHGFIEDCTIEGMNSSGASFRGEDIVIRRCVFRENGQLGFGAVRAHRLNLTDCVVENNNVKGFDRGWEAGGNKLVLCRDVVLERSRFLRNRGHGIWFDIGNTDCTVRHCLIMDNEDAGIFYEISFSLHAHDNVIVGNGFASTAGAWGAQAGISISSSPHCVIERNLIVANREGFNFREQRRTTPTIDDRREQPVWNHNELIRHNLIAFNRDAQVWGWFDVRDNRHWPAPPASGNSAPDDPKPSGETEPLADDPSATRTRPLTLPELRLNFVRNIYYAAPGQGHFSWGPTWARHRRNLSLVEFQSELRMDQEGRSLHPNFANVHRLDFRLPASDMPAFEQCYPRGSVPEVHLGTIP